MAFKNLLFRNCKFFFQLCSLKHKYFYVLTAQPKKNFKPALNMNTVYFYNEEGTDDLQIQLKFDDEILRIQKIFTFQRKISESVDCFLKRLDVKVVDCIKYKKKKGKVEVQNDKVEVEVSDVNSAFLINDEKVPIETTFEKIINKTEEKNLKLKIFSKHYEVILNSPSITELILPKNIYVQCPVFPAIFKTKCANPNDCEFTWFKRKMKNKNWIECSKEYFYNPIEEDLGYTLKLRCLPKNDLKEGPIVEVISLSAIEKHENFSLIEKRHKFSSSPPANKEIRVVSYNLLANAYATTKEAKTNLFTYCKPDYMDFDYRKNLILMELNGYNADLICLQEVDEKMFKNYLLPFLRSKDLSGIYFGKKREGFKEGSVFFFNNKKLKMMDSHQHVLMEELEENFNFQDLKEKVRQNSNLTNRIKDLKNQIQVGIFESLTSADDIVMVGNVHLYFHPDADHIRLLQGIISLKILLHYKQILEEKHPTKQINIIFCGDFNSSPDCGIYKLFTTGSIAETELDWKSNPDEALTNISFNHSVKMESAYGAPPYTNYTKEFKECLDYIFFDTNKLELKQIVPLPSEEDLSKEIAIPSAFFPSDHIALIADLKKKL